jgi:hypothetical protein
MLNCKWLKEVDAEVRTGLKCLHRPDGSGCEGKRLAPTRKTTQLSISPPTAIGGLICYKIISFSILLIGSKNFSGIIRQIFIESNDGH